jgi:predicted nuclease of predicted toxin-antitoxin system
MRVLLDHCLDWRLSRSLPGHTTKSVGKLGWSRLKDRPLLARAAAQFDVLVSRTYASVCRRAVHSCGTSSG